VVRRRTRQAAPQKVFTTQPIEKTPGSLRPSINQYNRERKTKMAETPIAISEHQFLKLKSVLARTCVECAARVVMLVDRDGHPIAFHGDIAGLDTTSFSSLAAGNVAATTSMAKLIGENVFPAVVHEGERESIFISVIGRSLLVVVFDERSTLSLVKLRTKKASFEVAALLEEMAKDSEQQRLDETSFFAEITDDDIDSLFS
jgi:predicted regulator of Ras-like GTPase activity (Roadblock/LC7/MglB family)